MVLLLACECVAVFQVRLTGDSVGDLGAVFVVAWVSCLALLAVGNRAGPYRPSAGYVIIFGLFHGGLLISVGLRGAAGFAGIDGSWLYGGYTEQAVRLAVLGMVVFTLTAELAAGRPGNQGPPRADPTALRATMFRVVGIVAELAGIVTFAWTLWQDGGPRLLAGGYAAFLDATESDGVLGYATLLIGLGAVLAVVGGGRARLIAWIGFAGYAVVALLVGTRGAVLFPLSALLVVEVRRGHSVRPLWTALGVPVVLAAIGLLRTRRLVDGTSGGSSIWSSPLDAVAEMGYSLRPTVAVLGWHSAGEPYRHGITYVAVPIRFIETVTGWHGGPPSYDDRLFNVEILRRVGPIGGSPIAEAYHNGGAVCVVLFMAIIGAAIGALERRARTPVNDALLGLVLLPLLIETRNSFAPVPAQVAVGLALLYVVWVVPRVVARRRTPSEVRR